MPRGRSMENNFFCFISVDSQPVSSRACTNIIVFQKKNITTVSKWQDHPFMPQPYVVITELTVYGYGDLAFVVASISLDFSTTRIFSVVCQRHVLDAQTVRHALIPIACKRGWTAPILCALNHYLSFKKQKTARQLRSDLAIFARWRYQSFTVFWANGFQSDLARNSSTEHHCR